MRKIYNKSKVNVLSCSNIEEGKIALKSKLMSEGQFEYARRQKAASSSI